MIDYKALIRKLFGEAVEAEEETIYRDEPIIRTASNMQEKLPEIYRKMRAAAKTPEAIRRSDAWLFCCQGRIIADATDDYEYNGKFERYFPTYQLMSDNQLRGYVSWRTKYRKGDVNATSLSFIFVYIYELLNLIGVKDSEDAFEKLVALRYDYCDLYPQIEMYLNTWLCDFVVYYGLDREKYYKACGSDAEKQMLVLKNYSQYSDDELFDAICALSAYKISKSRFYREYEEDVKAVSCKVYRRYSEFCEKNRVHTLFESMFGVKSNNCFYRMFSSAVFFAERLFDGYVYEVSELRKYTCNRNIWQRECYPNVGDENKTLGKLTKSIDAVMRLKYKYKKPLKYDNYTMLLYDIIDKEIKAFLEEKKKNQRPKIEIDLSKLSGIRAASEVTRDKLIVDEEPEAEEVKEIRTDAPSSIETKNEAGLDEAEYRFLHCLLYGGDYKALLAEKKLMLSVVVDSINEKLYEVLADTAIELEGDAPRLIDDYTEDLKGIVK